MYVNPFERMRKEREDKEKADKESKLERDKYARLGAQMGLDKSKGTVPSFMQTLMSDEGEKKVLPFMINENGESHDESFPESSPSPSQNFSQKRLDGYIEPTKIKLGRDTQVVNEFNSPTQGFEQPAPMPSFEPQQPVSMPSFETQQPAPMPSFEQPVSMPSFETQQPLPQSFSGTQNTSNLNNLVFNEEPTIAIGQETMEMIKSKTPSFQNPQEDVIHKFEPTLEEIEEITQEFESDFDDTFFDIDETEIQTVDLLIKNNNPKSELSRTLPEAIKKLTSEIDREQFFFVAGSLTKHDIQTESILSAIVNYQKIEIDVKRIFLYNSPYLFLMKKFINQLVQVSSEDKRVLWERVAIFLSATEYGRPGTDIGLLFEEELELDDPIISIKNEFLDVLSAYEIKNNIIVIMKDFRGLNYYNINKFISFVTGIFSGIRNMKFIIEVTEEIFHEYEHNSELRTVMSLFDIIIEPVRSSYEADSEVVNEENLYEDNKRKGTRKKRISKKIEIPNSKDVLPNIQTDVPMSNMNISPEPKQPVSSFEQPIPTPTFERQQIQMPSFEQQVSMPNFEPQHSQMPTFERQQQAVQSDHKPQTKEDLLNENPVRIRVDLNLKKLEEEKKELEEIEKHKLGKQIITNSIDPSVLVEPTQEVENGDFTDMFTNFNIDWMRNSKIESDNTYGGNIRTKIAPRDERDPNQIKEKLEEFGNTMDLRSGIDINKEPDINENSSKLSVPSNWSKLK